MWERIIEWTSLTKEDCLKLKTVSILLALLALFANPILLLLGKPMQNFWISIGIALFSLSVAFHSGLIAYEAKKQAEDSDRRLRDIANANFLGVVSEIEDKRIDIMFNPVLRRINVWKSFVHMNQAKELLDFCDIMPQHQTRLDNIFNHLLKLIDFGFLYSSDVCCEEVAHLLRMYQNVSDLLSANDSKEVTNTLIRVLFDEDDTDIMNIDVVNILLLRIKDYENEDLFLQYRDEIKNYFVTED